MSKNKEKEKYPKRFPMPAENASAKEIKAIFFASTQKAMKKELDKKTFNNAYNKLKLEARNLYSGDLRLYIGEWGSDISFFYKECESGETAYTSNNEYRRGKRPW